MPLPNRNGVRLPMSRASRNTKNPSNRQPDASPRQPVPRQPASPQQPVGNAYIMPQDGRDGYPIQHASVPVAQQAAPATGGRRPVRQAEPQVPQYDLSDGYPKGLPNGEGPAVIRTVKGKRRIIHGVPYEALNEGIQEDLDRNPLDDAGQLRIFVKDSFYGEGSFIEMGSEEHALKFQQGLRERGKELL